MVKYIQNTKESLPSMYNLIPINITQGFLQNMFLEPFKNEQSLFPTCAHLKNY